MDIWKNHIDDIPKGCTLTLTDASEGMVADDSEEIRIVCCFLSRKKLDWYGDAVEVFVGNKHNATDGKNHKKHFPMAYGFDGIRNKIVLK